MQLQTFQWQQKQNLLYQFQLNLLYRKYVEISLRGKLQFQSWLKLLLPLNQLFQSQDFPVLEEWVQKLQRVKSYTIKEATGRIIVWASKMVDTKETTTTTKHKTKNTGNFGTAVINPFSQAGQKMSIYILQLSM